MGRSECILIALAAALFPSTTRSQVFTQNETLARFLRLRPQFRATYIRVTFHMFRSFVVKLSFTIL